MSGADSMRRHGKTFDAEDVKALLDGRKGQFREVLGDEADLPYAVGDRIVVQEEWAAFWGARHPNGRVVTDATVPQANGDVAQASPDDPLHVFYAALPNEGGPPRFRPADEMPDWASRIALQVTAVRVGRLKDLTEEDAEAEGMAYDVWDQALAVRDYSKPDGTGWFHMWSTHEGEPGYVDEAEIWRASFRTRWDALHGPGSWESDPLVCIVHFEAVSDGVVLNGKAA